MKHEMTPDQKTAVETVAGDLAISAGAGSGKTTVLAHRFAHALDSRAAARWAPAEVDRILTITFTNKAAGEIAERVRRVVNAERSVEQGRRVAEAWISTIHTFCGRLVRRHVLESGVDPRFCQLDEVEAALLKADAFEAAAGRFYGSDSAVTRALDANTLDSLCSAVVVVHDNARAMGLDPASAEVVPGSMDDLVALVSAVHERAAVLAAELGECAQTDSVKKNRARLAEWREALSSCALGDDDSCERLAVLADSYDVSRLSAAAAKEANAALKESLEHVRRVARAGLRVDEITGLQTLVAAFTKEYRKAKADRGAVDFDDLQELAVQLLETRPEIARRYREHFRLLMIDEFQDTNELQLRVVGSLRSNNLCIVGDERQSIYGFRYADVEIFEGLRSQMECHASLQDNFRSHPEILHFVNGAFSQPHLFGPLFSKLNAGRTDGWRLPVAGGHPRVECVLADTQQCDKPAARAAEARFVAERIRALVADGCRGGDIAVLLRNATHASVFATEIERAGLHVLVSAGVELFDAPEVRELLSVLRTIAVPLDDEALAAVLASRFVRLSDDGLFALRVAAGKGPLWGALAATAHGEAGAALSADDQVAARVAHRVLGEANARQGAVSLHETVHGVCESFDFDLTLLALGREGLRAWGNVLKIARYAEQYEAVEPADLAAFVEHLRERQFRSRDKAAPVEAGEDVVRIMTIHGAKGLEFPVVFAADLGASKAHGTGAVLLAREERANGPVPVVGVKLAGAEGAAATPLHLALETEQKRRELEEQQRCLYVACTRAEELLVVSGATKVSADASEGGSIIDWVREAIGDPKESTLASCGEAQVAVTVLRPAPAETDAERDERPVPADAPLFVDPMPAHQEPAPVGVPRHVSYSSMHRHEVCPLSYQVTSVTPLGEFRDPAHRTAGDFGSALHAVMQTAGAQGPAAGAIDAAVRRYRLDGAEQARLEDAVEAFFDSALASRLAKAQRVTREDPIRVSIGESVLAGNVDVLAWSGSAALVVDYKTGRAPSADTMRRSAGYELQAKCYALAAFQAGATSVDAVFSFVEHGPVELAFSFSADEAGAIRNEIADRVHMMGHDTHSHLDDYDPDACAWCPALGGVCPVQRPESAS